MLVSCLVTFGLLHSSYTSMQERNEKAQLQVLRMIRNKHMGKQCSPLFFRCIKLCKKKLDSSHVKQGKRALLLIERIQRSSSRGHSVLNEPVLSYVLLGLQSHFKNVEFVLNPSLGSTHHQPVSACPFSVSKFFLSFCVVKGDLQRSLDFVLVPHMWEIFFSYSTPFIKFMSPETRSLQALVYRAIRQRSS